MKTIEERNAVLEEGIVRQLKKSWHIISRTEITFHSNTIKRERLFTLNHQYTIMILIVSIYTLININDCFTQPTPKSPPKELSLNSPPISIAAYRGNISKVQKLLDEGVDVISKGDALKWAVEENHTDIAILLINEGAGVNANVLKYAARNGEIELVKLLIKKGADVNLNLDGTALMEAAGGGHFEIVKLLVELRVDINAKDLYDNTALIMALKGESIEIAKYLLGKGAEFPADKAILVESGVIVDKVNDKKLADKLFRDWKDSILLKTVRTDSIGSLPVRGFCYIIPGSYTFKAHKLVFQGITSNKNITANLSKLLKAGYAYSIGYEYEKDKRDYYMHINELDMQSK